MSPTSLREPAAPDSGERPGLLSGWRLAAGTIAVSLAMFMNILDTTIANVSIPAIAGDLGVSPSQGTWVVTAYAVALAVSLPVANWLALRIGQVRAFVLAVSLFSLASLSCGLADTFPELLLARACQGASAGPMIPLSQVMLLRAFPRARASYALALWSMTLTLAPVVGPTLGGLIVDHFSWPWIFLINVPVAVISVVVTWSVFGRHETGLRRERLDGPGLLLLVAFAGCLQVALDTGREKDWFESTEIVALFATSLVALAAFTLREFGTPRPLVDLRLFRDRNFLVGTVCLSAGFAICFASLVLIPLWLQVYLGYTATWAGLAMAPVGIASFLMAPVVGRTLQIVDARRIVTVSLLVLGLLSVMRAQLTSQAGFADIAAPQLLLGVVMATLMAPLTGLAYSSLPDKRLTAASGLLGLCRLTSGAIAVALATTFWDARTAFHRTSLAEHISQYDAEVVASLRTLESLGLSAEQATTVLEQQMNLQARMLAFNDFSLASAGAALLLVGLVWFAGSSQVAARDARAMSAGAVTQLS